MIANQPGHSTYTCTSTVKHSTRKTRLGLPASIATDKKLVKELLDHIGTHLKDGRHRFLALTLTRSKPLRIKLLTPLDLLNEGEVARDEADHLCKSLYALVEQFQFPAELVVKLSAQGLDWKAVADGLRAMLAGGNSLATAASIAWAFSHLAATLGTMPAPEADAAKALSALIDKLEQMPTALRNQVVGRVFIDKQDLGLTCFRLRLDSNDFARFGQMLATAKQAYLASPGLFQTNDPWLDWNIWFSPKWLDAMCAAFSIAPATPSGT